MIIAAIGAAVVLTGTAFAKRGLMADDQKFLRTTAQGGMAEVALGHLAVQKALSAAVKAFGQRMIDDHSKANERLKTLALSKSVTLPGHMNPDQKKMKTKLAGLSALDFHRQYMKHMAEDHVKDGSIYENAAAFCHLRGYWRFIGMERTEDYAEIVGPPEMPEGQSGDKRQEGQRPVLDQPRAKP